MPKNIISNKLSKKDTQKLRKQITKGKLKNSMNTEMRYKVQQERFQRQVSLAQRLEDDGNVEELYYFARVQWENDEKYAETEQPKTKPPKRLNADGKEEDGLHDLTKLWQDKQHDHTQVFKSQHTDWEVHAFEEPGQRFQVLMMFSKTHDKNKTAGSHAKITDLQEFKLQNQFDSAKTNFRQKKEGNLAHTQSLQTTVKVNISPVFETHSLIIPYLYLKCAQYISGPKLLFKMLQFYYYQTKYPENYMVGFNSAGASSSVNHLHFQLVDMVLVKAQHQITKIYGEWHMEQAPVKTVNTSTKTGFQVQVCTESPPNCILKHATVIRWKEQPVKDILPDVIFLADQIYEIVSKFNEINLPYNFQLFNSAILITPRKHQSESLHSDLFAPALFEFFGAWRIKKFEQWGKGDQRCYNFCVADLQDLNDVKGDYINEKDMFAVSGSEDEDESNLEEDMEESGEDDQNNALTTDKHNSAISNKEMKNEEKEEQADEASEAKEEAHEASEAEVSDEDEIALLEKEAEELARKQEALKAKMKMAKERGAAEKERLKKLGELDYEEHKTNEDIKKLKNRLQQIKQEKAALNKK